MSGFSSEFHSSELNKLQAAGVHAAINLDFLEIYRHPNPQFTSRRFMQEIDHAEAGSHLLPTMPWRLSFTRKTRHKPAPCFGEHSEEVFSEELGINPNQYRELVGLQITGREKQN